jgi:hypothetical protein
VSYECGVVALGIYFIYGTYLVDARHESSTLFNALSDLFREPEVGSHWSALTPEQSEGTSCKTSKNMRAAQGGSVTKVPLLRGGTFSIKGGT